MRLYATTARLLSATVAVMLTVLTISAQQVTELFSIDKPLVFDGKEYSLAFSAKPNSKYLNQEYLPAGESFDHYSSMFTITVHRADITPAQAAESKVAELVDRKESDPVCNYMVMKRDKEYMVDFIVSDIPTGNFNTVEFDVHRYLRTKIDGKEYLVLLFYSERAYGDDMTEYLRNLSDRREHILIQMSNFPVPKIQIAK